MPSPEGLKVESSYQHLVRTQTQVVGCGHLTGAVAFLSGTELLPINSVIGKEQKQLLPWHCPLPIFWEADNISYWYPNIFWPNLKPENRGGWLINFTELNYLEHRTGKLALRLDRVEQRMSRANINGGEKLNKIVI